MEVFNEGTKEFAAAVMELTALGLIDFKDDEHFRINDKGIEKAAEIMKKFPLKDRLLVMIAVEQGVQDSPLEREDEE